MGGGWHIKYSMGLMMMWMGFRSITRGVMSRLEQGQWSRKRYGLDILKLQIIFNMMAT